MEVGLTQILVLDDNELFVETILEQLKRESIAAMGITTAQEFGRAARSGELKDVKLMFFDMNLGVDEDDKPVTAADVIPVARTYTPSAKILIFTYEELAAEDCIRCVRLGALGLIPKFADQHQLLLAARVYPKVGDARHATEEVIQELWAQLQDPKESAKGQIFEMVVANLLSTVTGLTFIGNNWNMQAGEIDLVFENQMDHQFWKELNSLYIIVECKNRSEASQIGDFSIFREKVRSKMGCRIGIMASWKTVSSGFRKRQQDDDEIIFLLDHTNIAQMISLPSADREPYLRDLFNKQG